MKQLRFFTLAIGVSIMFASCGMLSNIFKPKYGCKSNGKNVGAEKILSGDPEATKSADKAKKFRN
jgi:hypothetical protein